MPVIRLNSLDLAIGEKIKNRREELSVSQKELSKVIGMTFQQVAKYEDGRNRVAASTLYTISQALNTDIRYFYGDTDIAGNALGRKRFTPKAVAA